MRNVRGPAESKTAPPFDLQAKLNRICGVDLTSTEGIDCRVPRRKAPGLSRSYSMVPNPLSLVFWEMATV
jgi:hypothetical protein